MNKQRINLSAFKDGVADAVLEGNLGLSSYHSNMYSYKQGYDFGLIILDKLERSYNNE